MMALLDGYEDVVAMRSRAERALLAPIGMMSPLWMVFGAMASASAAWWWMTRYVQPFNVEAAMEAPAALAEVVSQLQPEPAAMIEAPVALVEAAPEPQAESALAPEPLLFDDFTRLAGVGPKVARALNEYGVSTFAQLAAWTAEELSDFDAALGLKGNTVRAAIVEQAKRLIEG